MRSRRGGIGEGLYGGLSVCGSAELVGSVVVVKRVYCIDETSFLCFFQLRCRLEMKVYARLRLRRSGSEMTSLIV